MNGIPASVHIGKTVREVIGSVASPVELMLRSVLSTGQSILNVEIRGELPTRNEEGCWIEHYVPMHDSTGRVRQVGVLVIEITGLRRLENCILGLLGNPHRAMGQLSHLGKRYELEKESTKGLSGSIETIETSLREALKNYHKLQRPSQEANLTDAIAHQEARPPYYRPAFLNGLSGQRLDSIPVAVNGAVPLSPREVEIVRLVASGKSNKEISTALGITRRTAETYRAKIMLKLQLHSMSDLVRYAVRIGLVKP
jgi:DNA-binding CsgD family transcriptional regulator